LRKLIHNFDRDNDFAINYEEFLNLIISRSNDDLRKSVLDKQSEKEERPGSVVESTLGSLLSKELKLVADLAEIAEQLLNSKDFTTYEAFLSIDIDGNRYIEEKALEAFMAKQGYNLTEQDILGIIYRLDADMDKRVSYEEFQQIFLPIKQQYGSSSEYGRTGYDSLRYSNSYAKTQEDGYGSALKESKVFNSTNYKKSPNYQGSAEKFYSTNSTLGRSNYSPLKKTEEVLNKSYSPEVNKSIYRSHYSSAERVSPRQTSPLGKYSRTRWSPPKNDTLYRSRFSPVSRNYTYTTRLSPYKNTSVLNRSRLGTYTSPLRTANYDVIYNSTRSTYSPRYISPRREVNVSPRRLDNNTNNILLARYFHEVLTHDLAAETFRENLSIKSDVTLRELFNYFNLSGRDSISLIDFREVLKELDVYSSLDEAKLIFKRYDKDMDGRIE
jgi:Ca2+-binding EF-hand superfamily protein